MNCGNMTDFEINKLIAKVMGFNLCEGQHYKPSVTHWLGGNCKIFDPCNNPSDAWPIIIESKISIMNDLDLWEASIDFDGDLEKHGTDEVLTKHYEHANPLRAAMIVYLMMQEEL